jgi:hypothetical protein
VCRNCSLLISTREKRERRESLCFIHSTPPLANTHQIRRKYLSSQYGFTCTCEVCTLPEEQVRQSDARLVALADLEIQVSRWSDWEIDGMVAVDLLKRMWELSEEEGYWYGRGELAEDAAVIAVAHSEYVLHQLIIRIAITNTGTTICSAEAAVLWGKLAVEWLGYELGLDSEEALQMQNTVLHPQSHPSWGSRDPIRVGLPDPLWISAS